MISMFFGVKRFCSSEILKIRWTTFHIYSNTKKHVKSAIEKKEATVSPFAKCSNDRITVSGIIIFFSRPKYHLLSCNELKSQETGAFCRLYLICFTFVLLVYKRFKFMINKSCILKYGNTHGERGRAKDYG